MHKYFIFSVGGLLPRWQWVPNESKAVLLDSSRSPMPFLHEQVWHFDGRARFVTAAHEGIRR